MKFACSAALAALVLVGSMSSAFAQDDCCDPCKRYTTKIVERTVTIPAVTRTVRTAVFETIDVPVYGNKCTPMFRDVKVPIYRTRDVPVYRTRRTPKYEEHEVPVYATREIPLTREVCDPCTGERTRVPCGCRTERYQSGVRVVRWGRPGDPLARRQRSGDRRRSDRCEAGSRGARPARGRTPLAPPGSGGAEPPDRVPARVRDHRISQAHVLFRQAHRQTRWGRGRGRGG